MDSQQRLAHLLRCFHRMHGACLRSEFEKSGLEKISNPVILFVLRQQTGMVMSQREIAEEIGVAAPTVATSIKRMERAGLVSKVTDPEDLRINRIRLTDKGLQMTDRCREIERRLVDQLIRGFTLQEEQQLSDFYLRMIHNMEEYDVRLPAELKRR